MGGHIHIFTLHKTHAHVVQEPHIKMSTLNLIQVNVWNTLEYISTGQFPEQKMAQILRPIIDK